MHNDGAVDPDDVDTWPGPLREALAPYAADVPADVATTDLDVPLDDADVTDLLSGRPLRAYHCTRLLPRETASVRRDGLRALSREHAEGRIAAAHAAGALTAEQAQTLTATTVYSVDDHALRGRDGGVSLVLGLTMLHTHAHGLWRLLSCWGGEATYWYADGQAALLRTLGRPSIVSLDLHLTDAKVHVWPSVGQVLASHLAGLDDRGGEARRLAPVNGADIVDIWQPGSPDYDRLANLPTA